jgi:hypothetical protein
MAFRTVGGFSFPMCRPARAQVAITNQQMISRASITLPVLAQGALPLDFIMAPVMPNAFVDQMIMRVYVTDPSKDSNVVISSWFEVANVGRFDADGHPIPPEVDSGSLEDGGDWFDLTEGYFNSQDGSLKVVTLTQSTVDHWHFLSSRLRVISGDWTGDLRINVEMFATSGRYFSGSPQAGKREKNSEAGGVRNDLLTVREF